MIIRSNYNEETSHEQEELSLSKSIIKTKIEVENEALLKIETT